MMFSEDWTIQIDFIERLLQKVVMPVKVLRPRRMQIFVMYFALSGYLINGVAPPEAFSNELSLTQDARMLVE